MPNSFVPLLSVVEMISIDVVVVESSLLSETVVLSSKNSLNFSILIDTVDSVLASPVLCEVPCDFENPV